MSHDGPANGSSWVQSVAECRVANHTTTHDAHVSRPFHSSSLVAVLPTTKHTVWCAWACGSVCHVERITSPSSSSSSSSSSEPFNETRHVDPTHNSDDAAHMEDTVRWCQMELKSEIQAVVLTSIIPSSNLPSSGHVPFLLIVVTRDGHLWRRHYDCDNPHTCISSIDATGILRNPTMQVAMPMVVPPTVPQPRSRMSAFGNERQSSHLDNTFATTTTLQSCLMGTKMLSLLDHGHNNNNDVFVDPTETRRREEEGILLVAAGDMLGPPQLIQMAVPSLDHSKSNHVRSSNSSSDDGPGSAAGQSSFPIHCTDIPGLQDVNSRVTCVLFISRTTMGEALSNAILRNLHHDPDQTRVANHSHRSDWKAVIFMGFENGSVQCSLVGGLSLVSTTSTPPITRMVSCSPAKPIHPLGLGQERVLSIRLMPSSSSSFAGAKDHPTKFIAVMGSFGTVTVLNGSSTISDPIPSNVVQPSGLPSTPVIGGVWTSATSFSCLAAPAATISKNSSETPRTATFIATRKDGSTYLYTIGGAGDNDTSSSSSSLVRLFVRRNMACVASCRWVQETRVQNVMAFLSWDGRSLSIMKMKEIPWRDINESLATFTSQTAPCVVRRRFIHDVERRHNVTSEGVIQTILRDQPHGTLSRAEIAASNYIMSPYETAKALIDQLSPLISRQNDGAYYGLPDSSNFENVDNDSGTIGDVASAAMMETRQAFRVVSSIQSQHNNTANPLQKTNNNNVDEERKDEERPRVDIRLHGDNGQMLRAVAKLGPTQQALVSNGSLDSSTSESVWNHSVHMLQSISPHHHDLSGGKDLVGASKQQRPLCFRHVGVDGGGEAERSKTAEEEDLEEIPIFYGGTAVSVSKKTIHSMSVPQDELCLDIPIWDRFPVSAYTSMSTAYTYNMTSPNSDGSDMERAKLEVDLSSSSRATTMIKKRKRRQDGCVLSQEPGYCKRGRIYNNQRESDSTSFSSSEHLGLIVPLTGEANSRDATWDILDNAMSAFNRDQEANQCDNSSTHDPLFQADCLVQEIGQTINSLHLNRAEFNVPAYLEDCCVASAFQNKLEHNGVTEFDSSLGSLSISPVSTFPATMFGPATKMVSQQPILGVDAISLVVTHTEENTTADVSRMIAFAVGGMMDGTELRSIVPLIRAALLRRLGNRYAESANNDTSISNREVIGACNSYHEQLLERRTAKAIRYITRTIETASAANNGASSSVRKETLIRLYERLRSLRLSLA
eukprot:CAMPEP_0198291516 /NCGR_PEP_ID=MMETSP1449-20131203/9019_1 /TAXON_ID=420275 /ORGANISM="Attheya septentrionalis, Strain CCMP2084" /LENGTH=1232 /DNA_ID=CAMNT_0043990169 /DNA_START=351 /DNA_END=4049 /DNA_ORIENTATION=+